MSNINIEIIIFRISVSDEEYKKYIEIMGLSDMKLVENFGTDKFKKIIKGSNEATEKLENERKKKSQQELK